MTRVETQGQEKAIIDPNLAAYGQSLQHRRVIRPFERESRTLQVTIEAATRRAHCASLFISRVNIELQPLAAHRAHLRDCYRIESDAGRHILRIAINACDRGEAVDLRRR